MDCTGCAVCVQSCPDDALYMAPSSEVSKDFVPHWDYSVALKEKGTIGDKFSGRLSIDMSGNEWICCLQ